MQHRTLERYLERAGPFVDGTLFRADTALVGRMQREFSVLVVGAGGLGCEILKNLALSGVRRIHVLDMDTVAVTNLNRQFLFGPNDVGRPKAVVAAEFIKRRANVDVEAHHCAVESMPADFYRAFSVIINGLDSVEARRWMNSTVHALFRPGERKSCIPIIDGGTEGLQGQSRVIVPFATSCYECTLWMVTQPATFPMCTIANTPRQPEHCITYALEVLWPIAFKHSPNLDAPEDISWIHSAALGRASEFGIAGVTPQLTAGVAKNIIPAVASTNAIVAAACVTEAIKLALNIQPVVFGTFYVSGSNSIYTNTYSLERAPDCIVCGSQRAELAIPQNTTVAEFLELLKSRLKLKGPSLRTSKETIYMQQPKTLEERSRPNLERVISQFVPPGVEIMVTDPNLAVGLSLFVKYD